MRSFPAVVRAEAAPTIRVAMQPRGGGGCGAVAIVAMAVSSMAVVMVVLVVKASAAGKAGDREERAGDRTNGSVRMMLLL